jgi:hypothetical protein
LFQKHNVTRQRATEDRGAAGCSGSTEDKIFQRGTAGVHAGVSTGSGDAAVKNEAALGIIEESVTGGLDMEPSRFPAVVGQNVHTWN